MKMKIENYIEQLLYRYQCVTVPGFGAFLTEIQSAQVNEYTQSFYPPKKKIAFNVFLKNNDGLLANHVAVSEKITYDAAIHLIENQVVAWKESLHKLGSVTLKNIGEISLNENGTYVFSPSNTVNYLTTSFGLSSYIAPKIKRENPVVNTEITFVAKPEEKVVVFTPTNVSTEKEVVEEPVSGVVIGHQNKKNNWVKYAAVAILGTGILGGSFYFGNQYYSQKITEETLAVQTKVQQQVNQKIQEATFVIENPLPAVSLAVAENNNNTNSLPKSDNNNTVVSKLPYHVIAGSFRQSANAEKIYKELLDRGYDAVKLPKNKNGMYPVAYGSFSSYQAADELTKKVRKTHNSEAWLLIEEL